MSTPNQSPDEFQQIGSDDEVNEALKPKNTLNLPAATAVLAGIVVLAIGLAGGAGLHAAFAKDSTPTAQAGTGRGAGGGYGGFRGQGTGQPGQGGGGGAAIGTVVSANDTQLVVKTQNGDVTVKLTGDTTIDITSKGTAERPEGRRTGRRQRPDLERHPHRHHGPPRRHRLRPRRFRRPQPQRHPLELTSLAPGCLSST